jgi:hypothetical protein
LQLAEEKHNFEAVNPGTRNRKSVMNRGWLGLVFANILKFVIALPLPGKSSLQSTSYVGSWFSRLFLINGSLWLLHDVILVLNFGVAYLER